MFGGGESGECQRKNCKFYHIQGTKTKTVNTAVIRQASATPEAVSQRAITKGALVSIPVEGVNRLSRRDRKIYSHGMAAERAKVQY